MTSDPKTTQDTQAENLEWSPERRACVKQAARLLGASEEIAKQFEEHGETIIEGFPLHVLAMVPGDGPWVACMKVARPEGVAEAAWSQALLVANAQTMSTDDWAFGLEVDGSGVLTMLLPHDMQDARFLAARLEGMLTMCKSVVAGAETIRSMLESAEAKA